MNANLYVIEDYENEIAFKLRKNKPKQTQSVDFSKLVPTKAGIVRFRKLLNFHRKNSLTVGTNSVKYRFLCNESECFYEELYGKERKRRA